MTTEPRYVCETWGCNRRGNPAPRLANWPDSRGARLCPAHRHEACLAQVAGPQQYHDWIMEHCC